MRGWAQSPREVGQLFTPCQHPTTIPLHPLSLLLTHPLALLTPAEPKMPQSFLPCSTLGA